MKKKLIDALISDLPQAEWVSVSPGRVNLLGGHVDYNDGIVLPAAIDRHVIVAAKECGDRMVRLRALNIGMEITFSLDDLEKRVDINNHSLPLWALYPAGVAWALENAGFTLTGIEASYNSDLLISAGLSSSAAVESAFAVLWQKITGFQADRMSIAKLCQFAENQYVGVQCGIMDQFACTHGVARHAMYLDVQSLTWQPLPIPPGTCLVIADSGIHRDLLSSEYDQRRKECAEALKGLREHFPDAKSLRGISPDGFNEYASTLADVPGKRARHVIEEIERVKQASMCLVQDDASGFGKFMVAGHMSLRDLYEVSLPQLDDLVELALDQTGCFGARLTGAGFGGCTINLVEKSNAEEFSVSLADQYALKTGNQIETIICRATRGTYVDPL